MANYQRRNTQDQEKKKDPVIETTTQKDNDAPKVVAATPDVAPIPEVAKPEKPKKIEIDRDEMVAVRNVTSGKVIYVSKKTGAEYIWDSYGTEEYLEAGEIITMKSTYPRILTEPWLVIDHEDLAKYLSLDKVYEKLIPLEEIDQFFTWSAEEIEKAIKQVPNGIKQLIGEKAKEVSKSLNGYQKQAIESNLNIILD